MQLAWITEPTGPRDRTGITYNACKEHKLSMHTPAPVFEHGAARNKRRASKATKRGGWLHKTLPKTPMGTKRQRKISNLSGNQHRARITEPTIFTTSIGSKRPHNERTLKYLLTRTQSTHKISIRQSP